MTHTLQSAARSHSNWPGLGFGWALTVLAAYQQFKLPPVLPLLIDQYRYDALVVGGFMSIYALAGLLLSMRLGRLIQTHGAMRYLYGACALLLAGNLWALIEPEHQWGVLVARGLEGVSFAVLAIAGHTLVTLSAGPRHAALAAALAATWIPVGQIVAALAASSLLGPGRWQLLWWAGMAFTAGVALWASRLDERTRAALAPRQVGGSNAVAEPSSLQSRALTVGAAVFGLWSAQYVAYMTWLPEYLVRVHGLDPAAAAGVYMAPVVSLIPCSLAAGWALRAGLRLGPLLASSMAVQAGIWLLLPLFGGDWLGVVSLVAYGVAAGATATAMFALPGAIMGHGRTGPRAMGVVMTGRNLGVLVGPVLFAAVLAWSGSWTSAAFLVGVATVIAALAAVWISATLRRVD